MNDTLELLVESAERLVADWWAKQSEEGVAAGWPVDLWTTLDELGLTRVGLDEAIGGSGGSVAEAAALVRLAARRGVPIPLAETSMLAGWLLSAGSVLLPPGPLTAAVADLRVSRAGRRAWRVNGTVSRVPWGRDVSCVVLLVRDDDGPLVVAIDRQAAMVMPGENLAGEPRDDLLFSHVAVPVTDGARLPASYDAATFRRRLAVCRAVQLAGAAERVLELSLQHVSERAQFGRPIASFQAVQHLLAVLAAEVTAMVVAADVAIASFSEDARGDPLAVAAAKADASAAAGRVAAIGHQLHGAIGFTTEHELGRSTTRLWAWRDEAGNETYWSRALATDILDSTAPPLWHVITDG